VGREAAGPQVAMPRLQNSMKSQIPSCRAVVSVWRALGRLGALHSPDWGALPITTRAIGTQPRLKQAEVLWFGVAAGSQRGPSKPSVLPAACTGAAGDAQGHAGRAGAGMEMPKS